MRIFTTGLLGVAAVVASGIAAGAAPAAPGDEARYFVDVEAGKRDPQVSLKVNEGVVRSPLLALRLHCRFGGEREVFRVRYPFRQAEINLRGRFKSEQRARRFRTLLAGQVRGDRVRGRTRLQVTAPRFQCETARIAFDLEEVSQERFKRYRSKTGPRTERARALSSQLR